MQATTYSKDAQVISDQAKTSLPSTLDHKPGLAGIFVECLLYLSIGFRVFGWQIGVLRYQGLSGAIVLGSGMICFFIMIIKHERLPLSFWFILVINILADISEFSVLNGQFFMSRGPKDMIYWLSWTLMACYIVRNERSGLRFTFFLSFCVFLAVAIGGSASDVGNYTGYTRMMLEGVGTMFANANALSQVSSVVAIALLFYGLKSKKAVEMICVCMALALALICFKTVSRQGLILFSVGVLFYVAAVLMYRKGRTGLFILIVLSLIATVRFAQEYQTLKGAYQYRLANPSDRTQYLGTALQDMAGTLIFGKGTARAFTVQGSEPHNTFLWLHIGSGGLSAWTYAVWIIVITWQAISLLLGPGSNTTYKIEVLAFLSLFLLPQPVNVFAPGNYGNMLALAMIERSLWAKRYAAQVGREGKKS